MPFVAWLGDKLVTPYQVSSEQRVICPECTGKMWVRQEYYREGDLIPRVFVHEDVGDCSGESNAHLKLKALAAHSLETWLPEATVKVEEKIDGTSRIADVVAHLPIKSPKYGEGIIVEAQVKNKSKNLDKVTEEYLAADYSVYWTYLSDISGSTISINQDRLYSLWPDAVPAATPEQQYHSLYRARHMRGRQAPQHVTAPRPIALPREFYDAHGHDIASPLDDPDWDERETIWLPQDDATIAWINVLHESGYTLILELWVKDRSSNTVNHLSNIPITGATDIRKLKSVCKSLESDQEPSSKHKPVAEVSLSGTELVTPVVEVEPAHSHPDVDYTLTLTRRGEKFSRSLTVNLTAAGCENLAELPEILQREIQRATRV